jgi:hypothetical protein
MASRGIELFLSMAAAFHGRPELGAALTEELGNLLHDRDTRGR